MLIPVTLSSEPSSNPKLPSGLAQISHDEIVLIELQGSLEVEVNHPHERNGRHIGTLKIDDATNKPTLLIGNHLLEGKIAALPKPYAILVRNGVARDAVGSESDAMKVDDDGAATGAAHAASNGPEPTGDSSGQEASAGWTINGIVKKKIIFSKRPMPVIGKKLHS